MSQYDIVTIGRAQPDLHDKIRIAVGHIRVLPHHIESSYLGATVITRKSLKQFNQLLNDLVRCSYKNEMHVDLLVLPEVSIPHTWVPMIVAWARNHQIGVICGLEHRIGRENCALNEVLAALPYRTTNNVKACAPFRRLKRIYSPEEVFVLTNNHLHVPEHRREVYAKPKYHLFQWRGASFAAYNCYELASLDERTLFKGKVDFIVCSEFNPDVNYFSNIVESAARDLHCYVIQANDSKYGDSRVVSPSKTEKMNPLRIKGGDNETFLTMELNLKALRDHQRKAYGLQKESEEFKPTPPGLKLEDVRARIKLGK